MKRQSFKLTIDNPCKQNWNSMTESDVGKYCSHCSKTVVDFTKMTDDEVIHIIEHTSGKLCGHLTHQQLNRFLETNQPASNSHFYKILAGLLLVGAAGNSLAADRRTSQIEIVSVNENEESAGKQFSPNQGPGLDRLKNVVRGKIFDAYTKEPLQGGQVIIKGTKTGAIIDNGKFKLAIPNNLLTEKITLVVTSVGYENTEVSIDRKNLSTTHNLLLVIPVQETLTGEICIIKKKKSWPRRKSAGNSGNKNSL